VKLTVNLDTQVVITQPAPMRIKAGCFVPVEVAFTRENQSALLPQGAMIEFFLTPIVPWPCGVFAYANQFTCSGNLYTGTLLTATGAIHDALTQAALSQPKQTPRIEANGEITWSYEGRKYRSVTFAVVIEAPVGDENPVAMPNPELYPAPGDIALKSYVDAKIAELLVLLSITSPDGTRKYRLIITGEPGLETITPVLISI